MQKNLIYLIFTIITGASLLLLSGCKKDEDENGQQNTVIDVDGNVYKTVIIGTQLWFAENIRTTKYRNGDPIPTGLSNTEWENTMSGAYAIYPHFNISGISSDAEVLTAYGALYNWYAVDDARGLCPPGWKVPTNEEWTILSDYLEESTAGGKMKSTRTVPDSHPRWDSPNSGATNETGFSALPGGYRYIDGSFGSVGNYGGWWSRTKFDYDEDTAWGRGIPHFSVSIGLGNTNKRIGKSIRCIKDN